MRWALHRGGQLGDREVADPHPTDLAVAPRLRAHPLDGVVDVLLFLLVHEPEGAVRAAGAACVDDHVRVAPGDEEVAGSGLDQTHRRPEVLNLPRVAGERDQRRRNLYRRIGDHRAVRALRRPWMPGGREEYVRVQQRAVPGGDGHGVGPVDAEARLAQVAVVAT